MRRLAVVLFALFAVSIPALHAQQSADEKAVRAVMAREVEGWAKFDANEVCDQFTADAIWQNPFGVRMHGRAELKKFLDDLMARPGFRQGKDTAAETILDLRLTSPTTAAVWSDEKIVGLINDLSGKPMDPRHSYYLTVLVKQGGQWKISDEMVMDIVHPK